MPTTMPEHQLLTAAPAAVTCKCCGAEAQLIGTIDRNKSCEDPKAPVFPASGVGVPYHRCTSCEFLFTIAFDHFAPDDWQREIYNDDYVKVDPDFVERRPAHNTRLLAETFARTPDISVLDYGGGNGLLAQQLATCGFSKATSYDPFYAGSSRPKGSFDLVSAFEVLEHSHTPYETLRDMRWFMAERGMLYFSTLLQPAGVGDEILQWWYASPRNGHVSLYSRQSLDALMKRLGLVWGSCNDLVHVAFRKRPPTFAAHLFR